MSSTSSTFLDVSALLSTGALDNQPAVNASLSHASLEIDAGNLLVLDLGDRSSSEPWLERARSSVQALFNELFTLPVTPSALGPIAALPPPTYAVPREKPLPKVRAETAWEKFRKEKGIQKERRGRMVWDENAKEYKARWGRDRIGKSTEPWAVEHNANKLAAAGASDPFELKQKEKELKKQKQKKQEVMNKRREIVPLTGTQLLRRGRTYREKYEVDRALALAQKSTASLGRFDRKLTKLKEPKVVRKPQLLASDVTTERAQTKTVVERVLKRQHEALETDKLARQQMTTESKQKKPMKPNKHREKRQRKE